MLTVNGLSFIPIQVASNRADNLVQKMRDKLAQDSYPPGLRESYEQQLELFANSKVPDIELLFLPFTLPVPSPEPEKPYLSIIPIIGRPFSRGTVHIQSADPKASPAIDPRYLDEDIDLDVLVDTTKFLHKVTQTEPFKSLVVEEQLPGPNVNTDEELYGA